MSTHPAEELARESLTRLRTFGQSNVISAISVEGFVELLKLIYRASFYPEEGRAPSFRVFIPAITNPMLNPPILVPLSGLVDVASLSKLWPIGGNRSHAIQISEIGGRGAFQYDGLIMHPGYEAPLGVPFGSPIPSMHGLNILVHGAGELTVSSYDFAASLRGDILRFRTRRLDRVPFIRDWLKESAQAMFQRGGLSEVRDREGTLQLGAAELERTLGAFLAICLNTLVERRHGGALIVVPDAVPEGDLIRIKHLTPGANVGDAISKVFGSTFQILREFLDPASAVGFNAAVNKMREWDVQHRHAVAAWRGLANLCSVDGCVVLNRRLDLLGFGGVIEVPSREPTVECIRHLVGPDDQAAIDRPLPKNLGGTRHQSAYWATVHIWNSMALVVSQDGRVTAMKSCGDGKVNVWPGLTLHLEQPSA